MKIRAGFDAILSDATLVTGPIDAALGEASAVVVGPALALPESTRRRPR